MNPKVIGEAPLSIYDIKKEMGKIKKRDTELSIRSGKTEEYVNQFSVLKEKEVEGLEKDIGSLDIPRLKDLHIKKIVDILPGSAEELKIILQGYALTISKENMQKIVAEIKKHQPEKP